jgi:hypothetical protein
MSCLHFFHMRATETACHAYEVMVICCEGRSPQGAASFPAPAGMHRAGRLQEALVLELPAEYHGSYDSFVVNMQVLQSAHSLP